MNFVLLTLLAAAAPPAFTFEDEKSGVELALPAADSCFVIPERNDGTGCGEGSAALAQSVRGTIGAGIRLLSYAQVRRGTQLVHVFITAMPRTGAASMNRESLDSVIASVVEGVESSAKANATVRAPSGERRFEVVRTGSVPFAIFEVSLEGPNPNLAVMKEQTFALLPAGKELISICLVGGEGRREDLRKVWAELAPSLRGPLESAALFGKTRDEAYSFHFGFAAGIALAVLGALVLVGVLVLRGTLRKP